MVNQLDVCVLNVWTMLPPPPPEMSSINSVGPCVCVTFLTLRASLCPFRCVHVYVFLLGCYNRVQPHFPPPHTPVVIVLVVTSIVPVAFQLSPSKCPNLPALSTFPPFLDVIIIVVFVFDVFWEFSSRGQHHHRPLLPCSQGACVTC